MRGKSLRYIAKLAGVSVYTVSAALRNNPKISAGVRKRIQKIAGKIGYVPNAGLAEVMAKTRATVPGYQSTLAYLDATLNRGPHPIWDAYREGVSERAGQLGYKVDIFAADNLDAPPAAFERVMRSRGINGIVIMWPHHLGITEAWRGLWKNRKCVLLAARPQFPTFALAMSDHFQVGAMAYQKAVEAGHQRIGIVQWAWMHGVTDGRFMGGIHAQQQFAPDTSYVVLKANDKEGPPLVDWYKRERPDCIITMFDSTVPFLEEAGVRVPDEVSVIYWDVDSRWQGIYAGPEQRPAPIAGAAVDLLVQKIRDNQGDEGEQRCLMVEPVWRDGPSLRRRVAGAATHKRS